MAKITNDGSELTHTGEQTSPSNNAQHFDAMSGHPIEVEGHGFISSATLTKDGYDLVLSAPDGTTVIVDNYFLAEPQPDILSPEGQRLSPQLVDSFMVQDGNAQYASNETYSDETAIGLITEVSGEAIITRTDGTKHTLEKGMAIFQGDIVETEFEAAVNITFIDESSFSIGEDARMAIDEFVFDPATNDGTTSVSILRGVFMYTSGLMGRDNPDSVEIETPVGSIGIRGTIIGGNISPNGQDSQITVVEGAIIVTNGAGQQILSSQFETVKLGSFNAPIQNIGQLDASQMNDSYGGVRSVSGTLFSSIDDSGRQGGANANGNQGDNKSQGNAQGENGAENGDKKGGDTAEGKQNKGPAGDKPDPNKAKGEGEGEGENPEAKDGQGEGDKPNPNNPDGQNQLDQNMNNNPDFKPNPINNPQFKPLPGQQMQKPGSQQPNQPNNNNNEQGLNDQPTFKDRAPEIRIVETYNAAENNTGKQVLAKLQIFDPDPVDNIDLNRINIGGIQNSPSAPVQIVLQNGEYLLVKNPGTSFNFEGFGGNTLGLENPQVLNIRIFDNNTQVFKDFGIPITVLNVNEAPTLDIKFRDTAQTDFNVGENGLGNQVIARLNINDEDARTQFRDDAIIISDNRFEVVADADGKPILKAKPGVVFDHETEPNINLTIEVRDNNDASLSSGVRNITINVRDLGENPVDITLTKTAIAVSSINENLSVGHLIGVLNTIDPDSGETFSYSLNGPDAGMVEIVNGNELRLKVIPDHETKNVLNFHIDVTDKDGLTYGENFSLAVNDLNEAPTNIILRNPSNTGAATAFNENITTGTVVATLQAADQDTGNTHTYTISGGDSANFTINGNQIVTASSIDFETKNSYTFNVTVNDGVHSFTKSITLNVQNVAEAPVDITLNDDNIFEDYSGTIYHTDSPVDVLGAVLGRIEVDDPENNNFTTTDFTITHPTNNATYPMGDYIEVKPHDGAYILKLLDNVKIEKISGGTAYKLVKAGVVSSFNIVDDGNGHFSLDLQVDVNDANAGSSYAENFKITVKDNIIQLDRLSGDDGFVIENNARNIGTSDPDPDFGRSVTAGDFNGDGVIDIATGSPWAINGSGEAAGGFYVLKGNAANPNDVNFSGNNQGDDRVFLNNIVTNNTIGYFKENNDAADNTGEEFADKITNLGDVNGDGYDDLFVTNPGQNKAYIYFGSNTPISGAVLTLTNLPMGVLEDINVTQVGDINGDGFNDILFGTPGFTGTNTEGGVVNLLWGQSNMATLGTLDYASAPGGVVNYAIEGVAAGDHFGSAVAGIGDFNGDGRDDFAVGARDQSGGTGAVTIYAGGLSMPTAIVTFSGPAAAAYFGSTIAGIGDINGDGYDDVLASAPNMSDSGDGVGEAYVIYGQSAGISDAGITGYTGTAANGFKIVYGGAAFMGADENLGTTMSGAGDFNGDGYDDFVITGLNGEMVDQAFLVYGGAQLAYQLSINGNVLDLQDILGNGELGMRLLYNPDFDEDGNATENQILSVSAGGDINQDGFDDIIMGVEDANGNMGETFVVYGRDTQNTSEQVTGTARVDAAAGINYIGNADDNYIYDSGISGFVVNGGRGNDLIKISNLNFDSLKGGAGFDTLRTHFSGDETGTAAPDSIDFRGLGNSFSQFEEIDIFNDLGTSSGQDTLHINISDVLDLLHDSQNGELRFSTNKNGTNAVKFYDDAGSNVSITSGGLFTNDADSDTTQDTVNLGGDTYYKYTLVGTDYAVLLDSQLISSNVGGSI